MIDYVSFMTRMIIRGALPQSGFQDLGEVKANEGGNVQTFYHLRSNMWSSNLKK